MDEETKSETSKLRVEEDPRNLRKVAPETENSKLTANLKGDRLNVLFLIIQYTITQMCTYFTYAMPIILQNRGVTYKQQVNFFLLNFFFRRKSACVAAEGKANTEEV